MWRRKTQLGVRGVRAVVGAIRVGQRGGDGGCKLSKDIHAGPFRIKHVVSCPRVWRGGLCVSRPGEPWGRGASCHSPTLPLGGRSFLPACQILGCKNRGGPSLPRRSQAGCGDGRVHDLPRRVQDDCSSPHCSEGACPDLEKVLPLPYTSVKWVYKPCALCLRDKIIHRKQLYETPPFLKTMF